MTLIKNVKSALYKGRTKYQLHIIRINKLSHSLKFQTTLTTLVAMKTCNAIIAAICVFALATGAVASKCMGSAKYKVIFYNKLSDTGPFKKIVPKDGLAFSPMTGVTHDARVSLFTPRGFASQGLQDVCETGNNAALMEEAKALKMRQTSVVGGAAGIPGGKQGYIEVMATCDNYYLTVTSMIAPSPDWIVQINNMPLMKHGKYIKKAWGRLFAYDCGTDSGRDFTDPSNPALDIETKPKDNIVPLVQDETDRFGGYAVGYYKIVKMN